MDEIKIIDYPDSFSGYDAYSAPTQDYSNINNYNLDDYYKFILENTNRNNAWSAEQAQKQMDFQSAQAALERAYGSAEAAKNRNWQEMMSNTAHQREMADLKAAGLNPVLSAMNGNGASVGSGATASRSGAPAGAKGDADQSANMAMVSMLNGFLNAQTQLESARVSAEASMAVADKYNNMSKIIEEMREAYSTFEHENYPSNIIQAIDSLIAAFSKDDPSNTAKNIFQRGKEFVNKVANREYSTQELWQAYNNGYGGKSWDSIVKDIQDRGLLGDVIFKLKHDTIGYPVSKLISALYNAAK